MTGLKTCIAWTFFCMNQWHSFFFLYTYPTESDVLGTELFPYVYTYLNQTAHISLKMPVPSITPIPKHGDRTNPPNWRPISLLSILTKLKNSPISPHQWGFCRGKSTAGALALAVCHRSLLNGLVELMGNCMVFKWLWFSSSALSPLSFISLLHCQSVKGLNTNQMMCRGL